MKVPEEEEEKDGKEEEGTENRNGLDVSSDEEGGDDDREGNEYTEPQVSHFTEDNEVKEFTLRFN